LIDILNPDMNQLEYPLPDQIFRIFDPADSGRDMTLIDRMIIEDYIDDIVSIYYDNFRFALLSSFHSFIKSK